MILILFRDEVNEMDTRVPTPAICILFGFEDVHLLILIKFIFDVKLRKKCN